MSDLVRRFTKAGNLAFRDFLERLRSDRTLAPPSTLLDDPSMSERVPFTTRIDREPGGKPFADRYEFGTYLVEALASANRADISLDYSLWNWLALYYFDQLCPTDAQGLRSPRETAVYYLDENYRHTRYYRHLVRSPWLAAATHPLTSRVILIPISSKGAPLAVTGEIFEQVASRQGMFRSSTVLAAIDALYFDPETGRPRRGTGGSGAGSPRRLGQILKQFELTFDLEWGDSSVILDLLPREFRSLKARIRAGQMSPNATAPVN